jgi:hypothetical protein
VDDADWEALIGVSRPRREQSLDGLRLLVELRGAFERVERRFAVDAHRGGASWQQIGDALGISRQAAFARHRNAVNETDGDSPRPFV